MFTLRKFVYFTLILHIFPTNSQDRQFFEDDEICSTNYQCKCSNFTKSTLEIHCSHLDLDFLPIFPRNAEKIIFDRGELVELRANSFLGLFRLKFLEISIVHLRKVDKDAFVGLENLEHLDLSDNRLSQLPDGVFDALQQKLQSVNLSNNSFRDWKFLGNLQRLKSIDNLDISFLNIEDNATGLKLPENLRSINLAHLKSAFLPSFISFSTPFIHEKLENVNISFFSGKIHDDFFLKIPNVVNLDLSSTAIKYDVLKQLQNCHRLRTLIARNIIIVQFTMTMKTWDIFPPSILHLDLSNASLQLFDSGKIPFVSHIEILVLDQNQLKKFNLNLELSSLEHLSLKNNKLTDFPETQEEYLNFSRLQFLDLSGNLITNLKSGYFDVMPNLQYLDLSKNQLKNFYVTKLPENLHFLDISINKLESFHISAENTAISNLNLACNDISSFSINFPSVQKLNFSQNPRLCIGGQKSCEFILKLKHLKIIDMSATSFYKMPENFFEKLPKLQKVDFSQNSLTDKDLQRSGKIPCLQSVDFSSNLLSSWKSMRHLLFCNSNKTKIDVSNNPFVCNCDFYDFVKHVEILYPHDRINTESIFCYPNLRKDDFFHENSTNLFKHCECDNKTGDDKFVQFFGSFKLFLILVISAIICIFWRLMNKYDKFPYTRIKIAKSHQHDSYRYSEISQL